jgi:membrane fusion protein (multidrug efflux system)
VVSTGPDAQEVKRDSAGRRRLVILGGVFLAVATIFGGYRFFTAGEVGTDDAIVDADVVPISAMVGGQVASVTIADNTRVKKGDVLLGLDTVEIQARLQQALGELAAAKAQADAADAQEQVADAAARGGLSSAQAQVTTTRAQVSSAEAQIASAEAQLVRAQSDAKKAAADLARGRSLLDANAITQERYDALEAAQASAQATMTAAEGQVAAARDARAAAQSRVAEAGGLLDTNAPIDAKIASAHANADLAHARVTTAAAALDLAQLALTRATIVAPGDGTVSKLSVRAGQVLVQGQQVGFLVPDTSYVVANFKETQVGDMKAGQAVDIDVDTYPGHSFEGVVESISAGTGSRFSVLAPDNASGNFVKVVQRVPVRIQWKDTGDGYVLRPGMSAVVTVHTE